MPSFCQPPDALIHTAFYKFTPLPNPEQVAAVLREMVSRASIAGITGSVLVAAEGINGMLAGTLDQVRRVEEALLTEAAFAGAFADMPFKRSACVTAPFGKLKVHVK